MQEMEKLCSRKLRITAKETMNIAEKLYTKGCVQSVCDIAFILVCATHADHPVANSTTLKRRALCVREFWSGLCVVTDVV